MNQFQHLHDLLSNGLSFYPLEEPIKYNLFLCQLALPLTLKWSYFNIFFKFVQLLCLTYFQVDRSSFIIIYS